MSLEAKLAAIQEYLTSHWHGDREAFGKIFETPKYPFQFRVPVDTTYDDTPTYMGELRGFYPNVATGLAEAFFQPYNSLFHSEPKYVAGEDFHRKHNGVDIYAPYFPFPHEVPLFALCPGKLIRVWTRDRNLYKGDYEALGNRARLEFLVPYGNGTLPCYFDYGHLSRFAPGFQPNSRMSGRARRTLQVKAGDLIGFVGKSGNADTKNENSTLEPSFRVNAGHLHLGLWFDSKPRDIFQALPRELAFHPDKNELGLDPPEKELYQRPRADQWDEMQSPALKEALPGIEVLEGRIATAWNAPLPRRLFSKRTGKGKEKLAQARAILPQPFHPLDFDDTQSLIDTAGAYKALKKPREMGLGRDVFKSWMKTSGEPDTTKWDETVKAFAMRAKGHAEALGLSGNQNALVEHPKNPGRALLAILHLYEAFWALLGAPVFSRVTKGRMQTACGLGVFGAVSAVSYDKAVGALHEARIKPEEAAQDHWVISVTFGSGSLRHAMLSERAVQKTDPIAGGEPNEEALKATLRAYLIQLQPLMISSQFAFDSAYRNFHGLLMGETRAVEAFQGHIADTAADAITAAKSTETWTQAHFNRFVKEMADANHADISEALKISNQREPLDGAPFSPGFKGLWLNGIDGGMGA